MAKVKVKIAVAVDPHGNWMASGYGTERVYSWDEQMDTMLDMLDDGEARYWVEAELDIPEAVVVQGNATPAT